MTDRRKAITVLTANTLSFTVCFAVWMMNGVLMTFLVDSGVYDFNKAQMGWLIGIPVLTGAVFRLPAGMLADRYGGRGVFAIMMLLTALGAWVDSYADTFWQFIGGGLLFGLAGATFAVGIAYSAVWFEKEHQGLALGIFGAGNAGAAITAMGAPALLSWLTDGGSNLDAWRQMPRIYAGGLVATTILFWLFTWPKQPEGAAERSLVERLAPLKSIRVWRFGLYYFLVFGGFVALAQWLIPYYVNVYTVSVAMAGMMSAIFTFPSGVIRVLGGWLSDRYGARTVMYWVLGGIAVSSLLLVVPRMDIQSPGEGVMASKTGTVTAVADDVIVVDGAAHELEGLADTGPRREGTLVWPTSSFSQHPIVEVGDEVVKKQLIARGETHIYFQANIWIFTFLAFVVGILMGIGKAAVYKHIPEYYPADVGTVGGIVGVVGGLGGFVCPIVFGYLLEGTGLWTTTWMFFLGLALLCLVWMHTVIRRMMIAHAPHVAHKIEDHGIDLQLPMVVHCPTHGTRTHLQVLTHIGGRTATHVETCSLMGGAATCGAPCVPSLGTDQDP